MLTFSKPIQTFLPSHIASNLSLCNDKCKIFTLLHTTFDKQIFVFINLTIPNMKTRKINIMIFNVNIHNNSELKSSILDVYFN